MKSKKIGGFETSIRKRLRDNKNAIIIITGETGGGKSYSALKMAEEFDSNFSIDRCVFTAKDFLKLVGKSKLKKGNVVIWDEVGIEMDARDFWKDKNKLISYALESFRYMNLILILTVPSLSFVDSKLRKLIHYLVESKRVDIKNERVLVKVFKVEHSPRSQTGKVYQKYLRFKGARITKTYIGKPSKGIIDLYEKKKQKFLSKLYKESYDKLDRKDKIDARKKVDLDLVYKKVLKNKKKYTKVWGNRKTISYIALVSDFDISRRNAEKIKRKAELKLRY